MARTLLNTIISAVAAVAVTIATGNPALGLAVFSLGSLALNLLNPSTPSSDIEDIRATKSAYGEPITIPYNNDRHGAHLVWASDIRAKERGHGGFDLGQDLMYLISEAPKVNAGEGYVTVKRIWLGKQLVFDIDPAAQLSSIVDLIGTTVRVPTLLGGILERIYPSAQDGSRGIQIITIRFGGPDQMPHPVQAAAMGPDNAPAYRGVLTIAVDNAPIHLYGNSVPHCEVEMDFQTTGLTPDFIIYDPAWIAGVPVPAHTEWTGYRAVMQILASPTYYPNTMYLLMTDNEDIVGSPVAIGRREVATGEWEKTTTGSLFPLYSAGTEKVAILDYDGTGDGFIWDDYAASIYHPPSQDKLYTYRFLSQFTGSSSSSWWVQLNDDYPFAFQKQSATPAAKGRSGIWQGFWTVSSNADGSMLVGFHNSTATASRFSMWAPGTNVVSYFETTDAVFAGLWLTDNSRPFGAIIDKHDHLWLFTAVAVVDDVSQMYVDEFSWVVGLTDITLTHLNRYTLLNQDGGFNTWLYYIGAGVFNNGGGITYNEVLDEFVIHWFCNFPSFTHTNHDPPTSFGTSQYRITHWDLATRSKKLSAADSTLLVDEDGNTLTSNDLDLAGREGFLGTAPNQKGDRFFGTWTQQTWACFVADSTQNDTDANHEGFYLVDIATGVGVQYGPNLWPDFLIDETGFPEEDPGVYSFAGAVYEPTTFCFWAVRRGEAFEGAFTDVSEEVFLETTEGFGRYFINPGAIASPWTLQQINEDIALRTGSLDIDEDTSYASLAGIVPTGFSIKTRGPARQAVEQLQLAFLYDIVEEDWVLKAVLRADQVSVVTVPETDVIVDGDTRHFVFTEDNEQELPRWLDFAYYSQERDFQVGTQPARIGGGTFNDRNAVKVAYQGVMTADEAATAAQRVLRAGWAERRKAGYKLAQKYLPYGPSDIMTLSRGTLNFEVKVGSNAIGVDWSSEYGSAGHDSGSYSVTAKGSVPVITLTPTPSWAKAAGSGSSPSSQVRIVPEPVAIILDTNLTQEVYDEIGYFITAIPTLHTDQGAIWTGADLERGAVLTQFSLVTRITSSPMSGIMQATLAEITNWATWDRETVAQAYVGSGTPVSVSDEALLAEPLLNLIAIGNAERGWELLQFGTASKVGNGVYWFSDLLRGRFGTEQFIGTHGDEEFLVLFDPTKFLDVRYDSSQINATRYWRAKNDWRSIYSDTVTITQTTRRLMPRAPYYIRGTQQSSGGNWEVTFIRRSRARGSALNDSPVFEATEDYEADILGFSDALVRTITTTPSAGGSYIDIDTHTVIYTGVDQLTDWGSFKDSFDIAIYQLSATVGRGYPGRKTI